MFCCYSADQKQNKTNRLWCVRFPAHDGGCNWGFIASSGAFSGVGGRKSPIPQKNVKEKKREKTQT